ncbi:hypothetical protein [Marivivens marinus]|uniref:hypothetical protein n=1 Tax=Marivivens marinus TaxID=3110173 RepID=UPI003B84A086
MKTFFGFLLSAFAMLSGPSFAQSTLDPSVVVLNRQSVALASSVYGYVSGQTLVLDLIAEQHPDLARDTERLKVLFSAAYGDPSARAYAVLAAAIPGAEQRDSMLSQMVAQLDGTLRRSYSRDESIAFLQEVQARIQGQIASPVLEGILWLKYAEQPGAEIAERRYREFSSEGLPKSLGSTVNLKVPVSWLGKDGDRPHIVQSWTNQNGTGGIFIALMIRDVGPAPITDADIKEAFDQPDWDAFMVGGGELIEAKPVVIENRSAIRIDQTANMQRLDVTLPTAMRSYMVPQGTNLVILQCMAFADPTKPSVDELPPDYGRMTSVCDAVANTIVFPDDY